MSEITKPIILDETGRRIADALGLIAIAQAGSAANIESWESVQQIVRNGLGPKAFPVGARLTSAHSSYTSIEWDVVAHNQHKKPGDDSAPTMTLLMHACIYGRMIDASEMLWANTGESALPAGTYNFTLYKGGNSGRTEEDGTYQFTTTEPIPAGGGWTQQGRQLVRRHGELQAGEHHVRRRDDLRCKRQPDRRQPDRHCRERRHQPGHGQQRAGRHRGHGGQV